MKLALPLPIPLLLLHKFRHMPRMFRKCLSIVIKVQFLSVAYLFILGDCLQKRRNILKDIFLFRSNLKFYGCITVIQLKIRFNLYLAINALRYEITHARAQGILVQKRL